MSKELVAPTGARIVGTAERLSGVAIIHNLRLGAHGIEFDWGGETVVHWDGQETVTRLPKEARQRQDAPKRAEIVFVDTEGDEWLESELVERDKEESADA